MLSGIGGRTIEAAKENLSLEEALSWFAYRRKHGPLLMVKRLEWALAQVAYVVAATNGGKKKSGGAFSIEDFLPKFGEPETPDADRQVTLDDLKNLFGVRK